MNGQPSEHKLWLEKADEDRLCIAITTAVEEEVGRKAVVLAEQICEAIRARLPN